VEPRIAGGRAGGVPDIRKSDQRRESGEVAVRVSRIRQVAPIAVGAFLASVGALQAQDGETRTNRTAIIRELSKQLRWHDEDGARIYEAEKGKVTQSVLGELDGFIAESFRPGVASAEQVKSALDKLLDLRDGPGNNAAFPTELPQGQFLIVGIELGRGGEGITEDAISFRAYKAIENRFAFVAHTEDLHSGHGDDPYLGGFRAVVLSAPPVAGEFWFIGIARVPPLTPPAIAMRLIAFNGERFRTTWAINDITAEGVDEAVNFAADGFTVNKLFDPTGQAALSPTVVIHEQYILALPGPKKVGEWQTERGW
jgi:hypothetical protein